MLCGWVLRRCRRPRILHVWQTRCEKARERFANIELLPVVAVLSVGKHSGPTAGALLCGSTPATAIKAPNYLKRGGIQPPRSQTPRFLATCRHEIRTEVVGVVRCRGSWLTLCSQVAINEQIATIALHEFLCTEELTYGNGDVCPLFVDCGVLWSGRFHANSPAPDRRPSPAHPARQPVCCALSTARTQQPRPHRLSRDAQSQEVHNGFRNTDRCVDARFGRSLESHHAVLVAQSLAPRVASSDPLPGAGFDPLQCCDPWHQDLCWVNLREGSQRVLGAKVLDVAMYKTDYVQQIKCRLRLCRRGPLWRPFAMMFNLPTPVPDHYFDPVPDSKEIFFRTSGSSVCKYPVEPSRFNQ